MATHMNEHARKRIEFLLSLNWPASEIARDRGRPESTILREIHGRRIRSDRNYGCSNRICAHYDTCTRIMGYGPNPKRSFRYSQKCYLVCPEFREAVCTKLANAPNKPGPVPGNSRSAQEGEESLPRPSVGRRDSPSLLGAPYP